MHHAQVGRQAYHHAHPAANMDPYMSQAAMQAAAFLAAAHATAGMGHPFGVPPQAYQPSVLVGAPGSHGLTPYGQFGHRAAAVHASHGVPGTPTREESTTAGAGGNTTPIQQRTQPQTERAGRHSGQQQARSPAFSHKDVDAAMTTTGGQGATSTTTNRRLERELSEATREELLQILLELSYYSPEAARFIDCKTQIFALRPRAQARDGDDSQHGASSSMSTTTVAAAAVNASTTSAADSDSLPLPPTVSGGSATSLDGVPETREFAALHRHPCVALYGGCRYANTCIFANCPQNLCVNFIRGQCPHGRECALVHRLPEDASDALRQLYKVQTTRYQTTTALVAPLSPAAVTPGSTPARPLPRRA